MYRCSGKRDIQGSDGSNEAARVKPSSERRLQANIFEPLETASVVTSYKSVPRPLAQKFSLSQRVSYRWCSRRRQCEAFASIAQRRDRFPPSEARRQKPSHHWAGSSPRGSAGCTDGVPAVGWGSGRSPRLRRVSGATEFRRAQRGGAKATRVTRANPPSAARRKESREAASPD